MWSNRNWILYGKESWLNKLPAYQGGGEMIKDVFRETTYAELHKFEAGTPNVAGGIVLEQLLIT
jgi:cysteine desulfurase/selenocysteine lyase